jgi:hypothetical protein
VKAIESFGRAVAIDPRYALAHTELANAMGTARFFGYLPPGESDQPSLAAMARALELDPLLPEAHSARAKRAFFYDRDWATAQLHFERALEYAERCIEINAGMLVFLGVDPLSFAKTSAALFSVTIATVQELVVPIPRRLARVAFGSDVRSGARQLQAHVSCRRRAPAQPAKATISFWRSRSDRGVRGDPARHPWRHRQPQMKHGPGLENDVWPYVDGERLGVLILRRPVACRGNLCSSSLVSHVSSTDIGGISIAPRVTWRRARQAHSKRRGARACRELIPKLTTGQ